MWIIGQIEVEIASKIAAELAKQSGNSSGAVYVLVFALLMVGSGAFYVLRYMLGHTKDIHDTAHANIRQITADHKTACETLTDTFNSEMVAQREQHHKDMLAARDMAHAARDAAQLAVSAKEFNDRMSAKRAE